MARTIVLQSPLTPVALATRLRDVLGGRQDRAKAGVSGSGNEQEMRLFVYRPNIENSFAVSLTGEISAHGAGARITGKIGMPNSALIFMVGWFGFLFAVLGIASFVAMTTGIGGDPSDTWFVFAILIGMILFGVLLYKIGSWTAVKDTAAILEFLATTVDARPVQ